MAGHFIWYELLTSDLDGAQRFYAEVVGWTIHGSTQTGQDYRHLTVDGQGIGGIMQLPEMAARSGMPPSWLGYIQVDDIDATARAIIADGGGKYMDQTIPGIGRFATVSDPQRAGFYIMTPEGEGASPAFQPGAPGHCSWNEYHGKDGEAALQFYQKHFGWDADGVHDMGPMGLYRLFKVGAVQTGGIMTDAEAPGAYWVYYFGVDDIDAAKQRVETAGGRVLQGPVEVPGGGWILNGQDPQGAVFALFGPRA